MKKLNLQLERPVFDWARAEAARLNLDLSAWISKILLEARPPASRIGRRAASKRIRPHRQSRPKVLIRKARQ